MTDAAEAPARQNVFMRISTHLAQRTDIASALEARPFDPDALANTREWLSGKASTIYAGSYEIQNNIISKRILGLPDPAGAAT